MTSINPLFESVDITEEGVNKIAEVRNIFSLVMNDISALDPEGGREFSIMKTKLEEACFYLNKSIAKNNKK